MEYDPAKTNRSRSEVSAETLQANTFKFSDQHVQALAARLRGEFNLSGTAQYDKARAVWNGLIDRYPALIVRCAGAADVISSINFAREHKLTLAVHGGGHNVAGHGTCDDGLVIDLSPMKKIEVDPLARVAHAEGGVTWGELDAETQVYGLAAPGGIFSKTGIAGLTLGGGFGWLRNPYGLSCDNLLTAQVVTADGRLVRASQDENQDLLWGLRGGGGNFGVVVTFEFSLHPVGPDVMFLFVFHDGRGEKMKKAIQFYRDYCSTAPDEVSSIGFAGVIPSGIEHYPAEIQGLPFFAIGALYAGLVEQGRKEFQPLREFSRPLIDFSDVMPYVQAQKMFDTDYPDGMHYYWKSLNLNRLDDEAIDLIVEHTQKQPSPLSTVDIWHVGGAVRHISDESSAFRGRQADFLLNPEANWEDPHDDEANIGWVRDFVAAMERFSDGSRYLNFPGFQEEGDEMMRKTFGPHYSRLAALKEKYDPTNLFRLNQNVKPANK